MKAIILAGGVGSRLRPMTCDCPKPMAPILDRPVMEYALRLLKRHGVDEAAATVCYLPDMIREYFGDGSRFGVKMHYYMETEPLGTAGGVKMAQEMLDETFFVLSGDGLTDCDLSDALRFHREKKAMATIVLKEAALPTEYGVAVTEEDGRIRNFLEKPDWSDVLSDTVNTGIYILEPEALRFVPEGVQADFSRDLFPRLMQAGMGVYGYKMKGYWCDIGDVESYLSAHRAFLQGEIDLPGLFAPGGVFVHESARVDGRARISAPCYIGPGAVVERDALIGEGSVVGAGARIGRGAQVKRSVLWGGARLEERAQASGCVLCDGAVLGAESRAYEGAVLGSRSRLGMQAALMPGIKIWPRKQIAEFSRVEQDVVWGSGAGPRFKNGAITLQESAQALHFGQIMARETGCGGVLLGCDGTAGGYLGMRAAEAGLLSQGVRVTIARGSALPVTRLLCRLVHADAGLFCTQGRIMPLTADGAELSRGMIRKLEKGFARESMPASFADSAPVSGVLTGGTELYLGDLAAHFSGAAHGAPAAVFSPEDALLTIAGKALARAGRACRTEWDEELMELRPGETGLWLNADGILVRAAQGDRAIDGAMLRMLMLWTALEKGERQIALPHGESEAAAALCGRYGAQVRRIHSGEGDEQCALAEVSPLLFRLHTDGIFAALSALSALDAKGYALADWQDALPRMACITRVLPVEQGAKGRVLRIFAQDFPEAELGDGVRIRSAKGRVWIRPSSDSAECTLSCEAADMPAAQSLMEEYARYLLRAANPEK